MQKHLKADSIESIRGWGEHVREMDKVPVVLGLRHWGNASTGPETGTSEKGLGLGGK